MANIRTGSIVADIRGKVGDEIYSRNKGGAYVKNFTSPVQPNTTPQMDRKSQWALTVAAWQTLTDVVRGEWNAYANQLTVASHMGDTRKRNGFQLFMERFTYVRTSGLTTFPTLDRRPLNPVINVAWNVIDESALSIDVSCSDTSGLLVTFVYMSPAVNPGVSSPNSTRFTFITSVGTLNGTIAGLKSAWEALYGSLSGLAGKKIFVKTRVVRRIFQPFPPPPPTSSGVASNFSPHDVGVITV